MNELEKRATARIQKDEAFNGYILLRAYFWEDYYAEKDCESYTDKAKLRQIAILTPDELTQAAKEGFLGFKWRENGNVFGGYFVDEDQDTLLPDLI